MATREPEAPEGSPVLLSGWRNVPHEDAHGVSGVMSLTYSLINRASQP